MTVSPLKPVALAAVLLAVAAGCAHASSSDAWAELYAKAGAACTKASGLNATKLRGQPVDFQAAVLMIVDGRYPQAHMKNAKGTSYCLYDKVSGKVEATEMPLGK
jgi:hypothetical protein